MQANRKVKKKPALRTEEGGQAVNINLELQLRRAVLATFLGESNFYEDGADITLRIKELVGKVRPAFVSQLAIEARNQYKLRHVPLLLAREMARLDTHKKYVRETLNGVIRRPDEISEALALYWSDGKDQPLANQFRLGLADAFNRFKETTLQKYNNQDREVKLRDAMFLAHPKPNDKEAKQKHKKFVRADRKKAFEKYDEAGLKRFWAKRSEKERTFYKLANNNLQTPNTWEVRLSDPNGKSKKEIWTELLNEKALGGLAFLRNLRNMYEAGVERSLILDYFKTENEDENGNSKNIFNMVLPFRFLAAANHAPTFVPALETAMFKAVETREKIGGSTILLIDVSGSMSAKLSAKSELSRLDTACALAILAREMFEDIQIVTFSNQNVPVAVYRGFALKEAITNSQYHGGTELFKAIRYANTLNYDRLIVLTDEQAAHDEGNRPSPKNKAYMINVANNRNGVGYNGKWTHLDGFSENILTYIQEVEKYDFTGVTD